MRTRRGAAVGRSQRGITLIELLAALLISGFIMLMALRIFLAGHRQFLLRSSESQRLEEFYRFKESIQGLFKKEVGRCEAGRLSVRIGDEEVDAEGFLKKHYPELMSAVFDCLEVSPDRRTLVSWKEGLQPSLIEYSVDFIGKEKPESLEGSWVK